MASIWRILPTF